MVGEQTEVGQEWMEQGELRPEGNRYLGQDLVLALEEPFMGNG